MDKAVFEGFRELVYARSGIALSESKEALVSARVAKRMRALGIDSHRDYLRRVLEDNSDQEVVQLIDAISTNVTSFFREPAHFELLEQRMKEWLARGQRKFRFWSAACSSGEEPYTMALTLREAAKGVDADIRILATDISTRILDRARQGVYTADRVNPVPAAARERYFERSKADGETRFVAGRALKDLVSFQRLNLSSVPFPMKGPLDAVFCRNVMIYFDNSVRRNLLLEIERLLKPGGFLCVGHAESLTGLVCGLKSIRPSVYVKQ